MESSERTQSCSLGAPRGKSERRGAGCFVGPGRRAWWCGLQKMEVLPLALAAMGVGLIFRGASGHCGLYQALGRHGRRGPLATSGRRRRSRPRTIFRESAKTWWAKLRSNRSRPATRRRGLRVRPRHCPLVGRTCRNACLRVEPAQVRIEEAPAQCQQPRRRLLGPLWSSLCAGS